MYFSTALPKFPFLVKILNRVITSVCACKILHRAFSESGEFCDKLKRWCLTLQSDRAWRIWLTEFDQHDLGLFSQLDFDYKKFRQRPYHCQSHGFPRYSTNSSSRRVFLFCTNALQKVVLSLVPDTRYLKLYD